MTTKRSAPNRAGAVEGGSAGRRAGCGLHLPPRERGPERRLRSGGPEVSRGGRGQRGKPAGRGRPSRPDDVAQWPAPAGSGARLFRPRRAPRRSLRGAEGPRHVVSAPRRPPPEPWPRPRPRAEVGGGWARRRPGGSVAGGAGPRPGRECGRRRGAARTTAALEVPPPGQRRRRRAQSRRATLAAPRRPLSELSFLFRDRVTRAAHAAHGTGDGGPRGTHSGAANPPGTRRPRPIPPAAGGARAALSGLFVASRPSGAVAPIRGSRRLASHRAPRGFREQASGPEAALRAERRPRGPARPGRFQ